MKFLTRLRLTIQAYQKFGKMTENTVGVQIFVPHSIHVQHANELEREIRAVIEKYNQKLREENTHDLTTMG